MNTAKLIDFLKEERCELGHGIYPFARYYELVFRPEALAGLPEMHIAKDSIGGLEGGDGKPVASLCGIHGLDFASMLAVSVGADVGEVRAIGAGTRARQLVDAILVKLGAQ